eukprot:8314407-Pyramimonas_sp.AAC.1
MGLPKVTTVTRIGGPVRINNMTTGPIGRKLPPESSSQFTGRRGPSLLLPPCSGMRTQKVTTVTEFGSD